VKIAIGSDHAGFRYKAAVIAHLRQAGHEVKDFGTYSEDSCDYPAWIRPVAEAVAAGQYERGIVLGGSGNGEAIVSNRTPGIRCVVTWDLRSVVLGRRHNDANVMSVGQRMVAVEEALEIVDLFLSTPFDGGRHQRRIEQVDE
jgi:ribose 5-phosphate isomerase B